jgi:hypothetical protein
MSEIKSKDDLEALMGYFSVPPRRLRPDYKEIEKIMRDACKKFNVEIPYWMKE